MAAQRLSVESPDRQAYEREWTATRNQRDVELHKLAAGYLSKTAQADPTEKKRLRVEQRKAAAAIVKAYQPEDFDAWLYSNVEREEVTLERLNALYKHRGVALERGLAPKYAPARRPGCVS